MKKTVFVLLSGGLDSMACVHFFKSANYDVSCINVDYGQSANINEIKAAKSISDFFGCPLINISCKNLPLNNGEIIGRNALLINIALFYISREKACIATGIHSGTNYSDCSQLFIDKMQEIADIYTDGNVQLVNPFINWTKRDIWEYCNAYKLPIDLTYSCETGSIPPCGKCLTCKDLEALKKPC